MENDSVRTSGDSALVDMWIAGKLRSIVVSRSAIEAFLQLPPDKAAAMTDDDRREFVRTHLGEVIAAATNKLHRTGPGADTVTLDAADLQRDGAPSAERRRGEDRRKGDRRKHNRGGSAGDRRQR